MSVLQLESGFTFAGWLEKLFDNNDQKVAFSDSMDTYFMFQALLASMENGFISSPNPSVGCVVVKDNKIISRGCTEAWGQRHAEQVAFSKLNAEELNGSSIYVTLEPCTHYGKQPPCIDLFKNKGIEKVFIARKDVNPIVSGKGIQILKNFGIEVNVGLFSNEVTAINYPFFIEKKYNRPMISLKWAQSLDGCLADDFQNSKWISSNKSRIYTHWLRQKYDSILVGARTFLADFPSLDVRDISYKNKKNPVKIIFDPSAKTILCSNDVGKKLKEKMSQKKTKTLFLVDESMIKVILNDSSDWCVELRNSNEVKILSLAKQGEHYSASDILHCLVQKEVTDFLQKPLQSILIEGGSYLLNLFAKEDFFDVAHVFVSPFLIGSKKHRILANESNRVLSSIQRWKLISNARIGDDILMEMIPSITQEECVF